MPKQKPTSTPAPVPEATTEADAPEVEKAPARTVTYLDLAAADNALSLLEQNHIRFGLSRIEAYEAFGEPREAIAHLATAYREADKGVRLQHAARDHQGQPLNDGQGGVALDPMRIDAYADARLALDGRTREVAPGALSVVRTALDVLPAGNARALARVFDLTVTEPDAEDLGALLPAAEA